MGSYCHLARSLAAPYHKRIFYISCYPAYKYWQSAKVKKMLRNINIHGVCLPVILPNIKDLHKLGTNKYKKQLLFKDETNNFIFYDFYLIYLLWRTDLVTMAQLRRVPLLGVMRSLDQRQQKLKKKIFFLYSLIGLHTALFIVTNK